MAGQWKRRKVEAARRKKTPGKQIPGQGRITKNVWCPYCGEGNSHEVPTTHEELRPVICPHCEQKFDLRVYLGGQSGAHYRPRNRRGPGKSGPPPIRVTPENVVATLVQLDADRKNGVFTILENGVTLEPPAPSATVRRMQEAAVRDLGVPIPNSFAALLLMCNGACFNGALFKTAERLVYENLADPRPGLVVLGKWFASKGTYEFLFDPQLGRFNITPEGKTDEQLKSFSTFEELLVYIVQSGDWRNLPRAREK